jgi:hypothetical protein
MGSTWTSHINYINENNNIYDVNIDTKKYKLMEYLEPYIYTQKIKDKSFLIKYFLSDFNHFYCHAKKIDINGDIKIKPKFTYKSNEFSIFAIKSQKVTIVDLIINDKLYENVKIYCNKCENKLANVGYIFHPFLQ